MKKWCGLFLILVLGCCLMSCEWRQEDEWDIEGTVTTVDNQPMEGVPVSLKNGATLIDNDFTDAYGFFTMTEDTAGNYTLIPRKEGYYFEPDSRALSLSSNDYTLSNQNFTAVKVHTITGTVHYKGSPLSGISVTLSGDDSQLTTTDSSGNYTFLVAQKGTFTVSANLNGIWFNPQLQTVTITSQNRDAYGIDLYAREGIPLSGHILCEGHPMQGITVLLSGNLELAARTGADGFFLFKNLPQGQYTIVPRGNPSKSPDHMDVTLTQDGAQGLDFEIFPQTWEGSYNSDDNGGTFTELSGYTDINGSLAVYGVQWESMPDLEYIRSVQGGLWVYYSSIRDLTGLDNLSYIGGGLSVYRSDLTDLTGLDNLTYMGEGINLFDNNSLVNLKGLDHLTHYGDYLTVRANDKLESIAQLRNAQAETKIWIDGNKVLKNLDGLQNTSLRELNDVDISSNSMLESIEHLGNTQTTIGDLLLIQNYKLKSIKGLESITTIKGRLIIQYAYELTSLDGLDNVTLIHDDLHLMSNDKLQNIAALSNVTETTNTEIVITGCDSLTSLHGLEHVSRIFTLIISGNASLESLDGLISLSSTAPCIISGNAILTDLSGLSSLHRVNGNLVISGNPSLIAVASVGHVDEITGNLEVSSNQQLCENLAWDLVDAIGRENIDDDIIIEDNKKCN